MNWTDPGIGDENAPPGSEEWAKFWRLAMQRAIKNASFDQDRVCSLYQHGVEHRAWSKLTRKDGSAFKTWEAFVSEAVPWGLGSKPDAVKTILEARHGRRATQRETVPEPSEPGRGKIKPGNDCPISDRTAKNLRAINRAPEIVGRLYDEGMISQVDAAKLGKKELDAAEVAAEIARVVEETKEVESVKERRKAIKEVAKRVGGGKAQTTVDKLKKLWGKATEQERAQFLKYTQRGNKK
jgi:hypothetical protein